MNYQYFEEPLKVQNNQSVYCPYVKVTNKYINTPLPQPQKLNGNPVTELCLPNLSDRMYIPGFGLNYCKNNKPIHLNFREKSECYSTPTCEESTKLNTCYDPYMQN